MQCMARAKVAATRVNKLPIAGGLFTVQHFVSEATIADKLMASCSTRKSNYRNVCFLDCRVEYKWMSTKKSLDKLFCDSKATNYELACVASLLWIKLKSEVGFVQQFKTTIYWHLLTKESFDTKIREFIIRIHLPKNISENLFDLILICTCTVGVGV